MSVAAHRFTYSVPIATLVSTGAVSDSDYLTIEILLQLSSYLIFSTLILSESYLGATVLATERYNHLDGRVRKLHAQAAV